MNSRHASIIVNLLSHVALCDFFFPNDDHNNMPSEPYHLFAVLTISPMFSCFAFLI